MKEQPEVLDLSALDTAKGAEQGYELTLSHPKTGEPTPMKITVLGADSDAYREKLRDFQRRRADRMNKGRRLSVTPEEIEAETLEMLVAVTTGWSGFTLDGAPLPFSGDNARTVYRRFSWIREQVDQAVGDRANFLPTSASAS